MVISMEEQPKAARAKPGRHFETRPVTEKLLLAVFSVFFVRFFYAGTGKRATQAMQMLLDGEAHA